MINEWFKNDINQLKAGVACDPVSAEYQCLVCGQTFHQGEIYPIDNRFFDAAQAARQHVQAEHGGMANHLLGLDKKDTWLTDNQKELMALQLSGLSDSEIAARTGVSPATVRHVRFTLRERARQAKLYLALYELTAQAGRNPMRLPAENSGRRPASPAPADRPHELVAIHAGARMVDDRYAVTQAEQEKILKDCFLTLEPLRLKVFSAREKKKIVILRRIAGLFDPDKSYGEREINALLRPVYDDFATIRRYLIEYGFMERNADGSVYRLRQNDGNG